MNLNIENLVRSGVVLVVGLPLALGVNGLVGTFSELAKSAAETSVAQSVQDELKGQLTKDCLMWAFTDVDSKLERQSKDNIDEALGGQADYGEVCKWVLR